MVGWRGEGENSIGREGTSVLGGGERGERAGRMGAGSRKEEEREAARGKQERFDKGLGERRTFPRRKCLGSV